MSTSAEMAAKCVLENELLYVSLMLSGDLQTTLPAKELETVKNYFIKRLDSLK